jgi:putative ABC transport system permease protein
MLSTSLKIAQKALNRNKLRTGLAILGMTIGVGAVLTMFALGTGAQESVSSDVKSAGTTLIFVRAGNFTRGGDEMNIPSGMGSANSLVPADTAEIAKIDGVKYTSSNVSYRSWVEGGGQRQFAQVIGADVEYPKAYGWGVPKGKFFKSGDVSSAEHVVVLGSTLKEQLFGDDDAVGQTVQIHNEPYKVVGIFESKDEDQAANAVIPYTAAQKTLNNPSSIQMVTVSAGQAGDTTRISDDIKKLLRKRHALPTGQATGRQVGALGGLQGATTNSAPDDFTVKTQASEALTKGLNTSVAAFILANMPQMDQTNSQEMAGTLNRAGATMTALLAAIATISLIVGGIGIMNIMLVSVTERTREIGIRRAMGAKKRDVLEQFLVEAVWLAVFGGVFGILMGFIASTVITNVLEWPASISITAIALAFGIAFVTGVFFGFYPARKASLLSPIDALRYE